MEQPPGRVQEALGQLVGAAREGLLALSVEVGLGVLRELLEQEVDELVGPKGKWNPDRTAVRHGHETGEVTLGGRRVAVERPRVRTADGESEVAVGRMSTSLSATSWRTLCSSGCWPASRLAGIVACRSRSASGSRWMIVTFTGAVAPNDEGKRVQLQRQVGGMWVKVTAAELTAASKYTFKVRTKAAGRFVYRVSIAAIGRIGHATSSTVTVTVT